MLEALQRHFSRHAGAYTIASLLGLQGFCTAYYDNFWPIEPDQMQKLGWWQVAAAFVKSLSFGLGVLVGYLIKPPNTEATKTETNPPFQSASKS